MRLTTRVAPDGPAPRSLLSISCNLKILRFEAPWEGGYRVNARFEADMCDAPKTVTVLGEGEPVP